MPSPEADNPSITVVVPTYQRREMVLDTVRALCRVEYEGSFDIVVVVDGSTDGTGSALAGLDSPVPLRVVVQENRGLAAARNRGAAEASGEIILFLDDDMACERDLLHQHARAYRDGADAVVGDCPPEIEPNAAFLSRILTDGRYREGLKLTAFDIFGGHLSVRRSVFRELGGFDELFTEGGRYGNEDIDFGQRLLKRHKVVHNHLAACRQRIVVGPREYIRRARDFARADLYFASKHPELARELLDRRGARRLSRRLRLLSRMPFVPRALTELAGYAVDAGSRTGLGSTRTIGTIFSGAYALAYWSSMLREPALPSRRSPA